MPIKLMLPGVPQRTWCSPGSDRKQTIELNTHGAKSRSQQQRLNHAPAVFSSSKRKLDLEESNKLAQCLKERWHSNAPV